MKLNWVIGDIHGCFNALQRLEAKITARCRRLDAEPFFVSVGDLVDRGPHSAEVVEHFLQGTAKGTHQAIVGNHEVLMINCLEHHHPRFGDSIPAPVWYEDMETRHARRRRLTRYSTLDEYIIFNKLVWMANGGADTVTSYGGDPYTPETWSVPEAHFAYLAGRPLFWEDEHAIATHALAHASDIDALRTGGRPSHDALERTLWGRARPKAAPAPPKRHLSGHTPLPRVYRDATLDFVQIDTGAYMGGRLTAWCTALETSISVASRVRWEM